MKQASNTAKREHAQKRALEVIKQKLVQESEQETVSAKRLAQIEQKNKQELSFIGKVKNTQNLGIKAIAELKQLAVNQKSVLPKERL